MTTVMRRRLLSGVLIAALASVAAARESEVLQSFEHDFEADGVEEVRIEIPAGEVTVNAGDVDRIRVSVEVRCGEGLFRRSCERRADHIELEDRRRGGRLDLEVAGPRSLGRSGVQIHATITLPRDLDVSVDLGFGEVEIRGVQGSLAIDVSVGAISVAASGGEVRIDLGIGDVAVEVLGRTTRQVAIELGIGESVLIHPDGRLSRSGVFGSENLWNGGQGEHGVFVDLGIGAVEVVVR